MLMSETAAAGEWEVSMKTADAVTQLKEYHASQGPKYELLKKETASASCDLFKYKVTLNSDHAFGEGKSKKLAKHEAARNLMKTLGVWKPQVLLYKARDEGVSGSREEKPKLAVAEEVTGPKENTVGMLNELCQQNKWPSPTFSIKAPEMLFSAQVCIENVGSASGSGCTKKQAQWQAARNLIGKLKHVPASDGKEVIGELLGKLKSLSEEEKQHVDDNLSANQDQMTLMRKRIQELLKPRTYGLFMMQIEKLYEKTWGEKLVCGGVEQLEREGVLRVERPQMLVTWVKEQ